MAQLQSASLDPVYNTRTILSAAVRHSLFDAHTVISDIHQISDQSSKDNENKVKLRGKIIVAGPQLIKMFVDG